MKSVRSSFKKKLHQTVGNAGAWLARSGDWIGIGNELTRYTTRKLARIRVLKTEVSHQCYFQIQISFSFWFSFVSTLSGLLRASKTEDEEQETAESTHKEAFGRDERESIAQYSGIRCILSFGRGNLVVRINTL